MAKLIPLPRYEELPEVILFHRSHPSDPRLLLQVPTGPDSAETFVLNLEQRPMPVGEYDPRTDHKGWVKRLPNSQALLDKLAIEPHVAYYHSRGGSSMVLDNPDEIPWVRKVMTLARLQTAQGSMMEGLLTRRAKRTLSRLPSPLRQSIDGRNNLGYGGVAW